jgi:hypothetical protein
MQGSAHLHLGSDQEAVRVCFGGGGVNNETDVDQLTTCLTCLTRDIRFIGPPSQCGGPVKSQSTPRPIQALTASADYFRNTEQCRNDDKYHDGYQASPAQNIQMLVD